MASAEFQYEADPDPMDFAEGAHAKRVGRISGEVRARPDGLRLKLVRDQAENGKGVAQGNTNTAAYKRKGHPVYTGDLTNILNLDVEGRTVVVEGAVRMVELCRATLAAGLMPPVVPGETFTVAGLISGGGIDASSSRHGLFFTSLVSMEVVLANGDVVLADGANELKDLFEMIPHSYGTVGLVVAARLRLIPAGDCVVSTYRHYRELELYGKAMRDALEGAHARGAPHEFVEGLVYGPNSYVLVTTEWGHTRDPATKLLPNFETWGAKAHGNEWYFQHAESTAKKKQTQKQKGGGGVASGGGGSGVLGVVDRMPTLDFVFRHQRGFMWVVDMYVNNGCLTKSRCGRRKVDDAVADKVARGQEGKGLLTQSEMERCRVFQVRVTRLS